MRDSPGYVQGLDGAKGRWLSAVLPANGELLLSDIDLTIIGFDDKPAPHELTFVDAPIGLLFNSNAKPTPKGVSGIRPVDRGAKLWCRSSSSVFSPPTEEQLRSGLAEISKASRESRPVKLANVAPGGLSKQTLGILPAIESAAKWKAFAPDRVFEAHPEAIFAALVHARARAGKNSLRGIMDRAAAIRASLTTSETGEVLDFVANEEHRLSVGADDVVDAIALALAARSWCESNSKMAILDATGVCKNVRGQGEPLLAMPAMATQPPS